MGAQCMRVVCTPTQPSPSCRPGTRGLELLGQGLFWAWYGSLASLSHTMDAKGTRLADKGGHARDPGGVVGFPSLAVGKSLTRMDLAGKKV